MSTEIPYYQRNTLYGPERLTMPISRNAQEIDIVEFRRLGASIGDIYLAFRLLWEMEQGGLSEMLRSIPIEFTKAPYLARAFKIPNRIPPPTNSIVRLDVVGEKVVDINNKPAGLGLITAAEYMWSTEQVWPVNTFPIRANLSDLFDSDSVKKVIIATELDYAFSSDQVVLSRLIEQQTGIPCETMDPQLQGIDKLGFTDIVACFSYLAPRKTQRGWIPALFKQRERFVVNPVTSLIWDNKALMALPFLGLTLPFELRDRLIKLREVFPPTYIFKKGDNNELLIGSTLTIRGIGFTEITKENVPSELCRGGKVYIKPLGQSGGRDIVVKNFQDRGGVYGCLMKSVQDWGTVVQEAVEPKLQNGYIKDGYFFDSKRCKIITIERMQSPDNQKIHGGSKTDLVPVYIRK